MPHSRTFPNTPSLSPSQESDHQTRARHVRPISSLFESHGKILDLPNFRVLSRNIGPGLSLTLPSRHDLTVDERKAYTSAVLCLQAKEPQTPSSLAPGAKTRYDDWIVTHINQTYTIHFNANFLGWHRWFIWEHEQALRNECGYTGYLPYWDWTKTAESGLSNSPIFDGSDSSMSGDGASMNYTSSDEVVINAGTAAEMHFPAGTGGGCVTSGPFVNYTLNLGPDGLAMVNEDGLDNSSYPFQYNPRCLQRSLTDHVNQRYANSSSVLTLLRDPQDVWTFETLMSGDSAYPELGVHGGGHWSLGKLCFPHFLTAGNRRLLTMLYRR